MKHKKLIKELDKLSDHERYDVISRYCGYCGVNSPDCQCWNDE